MLTGTELIVCTVKDYQFGPVIQMGIVAARIILNTFNPDSS